MRKFIEGDEAAEKLGIKNDSQNHFYRLIDDSKVKNDFKVILELHLILSLSEVKIT